MAQGPFPDGVTPLDELEILVVADNETDTLSSVEEGVPQVSEVVHLAARTPPSRRYKGHDCKVVFDQLCLRLSRPLGADHQPPGRPAAPHALRRRPLS